VRIALPLSFLLVLLLAAGCGGGSQPSAAEQWAGSVCSSISTWQTEINKLTTETADALSKPGNSRAQLKSAFDSGLQATQTLVDDLKALGPPDTPEGAQAKQDVDAFAKQAQTTADDVQSAVSALPSSTSLAQAVATLAPLGAELQATIQKGSELITTLTGLGGSIKDGFESADSCKELRAGQ
jgi:hypothetical protein